MRLRQPHIAEHALISVGTNHARLQMHRGAGHAELFLSHPCPKRQGGECDHGVGVGLLFDQAESLRNRRHNDAGDDGEAFAQMPYIRVTDGHLRGLDISPSAKKSKPLRFDQGLKQRVGEKGDAMPAPPQG